MYFVNFADLNFFVIAFWCLWVNVYSRNMSATQVQRKLEFPVKKRVTRNSKKSSRKENNENSPLKKNTQLASPRKRQGEGVYCC